MVISGENLAVIRKVISAFNSLHIPYALGGSTACLVYGTPRFTQDADIIAEPFPGKEAEFIAFFEGDYYVSYEAVTEAIRKLSSFNIISLVTGFKVDVFIRKDRPFERALLPRRVAQTMSDAPAEPIYFVSPEDIILLKLEWFRMGDEVAVQQWLDILGVLKAQAGKLDEAYLDHWAADLKVNDLLARARAEAGN